MLKQNPLHKKEYITKTRPTDGQTDPLIKKIRDCFLNTK